MLSMRIGRVNGYFYGSFHFNESRFQQRLAGGLIDATEVVAASAEPCNPAIVKAFGHRLAMGADVRSPFDPARMGADA